jgi:hypothetical protein
MITAYIIIADEFEEFQLLRNGRIILKRYNMRYCGPDSFVSGYNFLTDFVKMVKIIRSRNGTSVLIQKCSFACYLLYPGVLLHLFLDLKMEQACSSETSVGI